MKFVEYMSASHLNSENAALYETKSGATLKAENVETDKVNGKIDFDSVEDAKDWYSELEGNGIGQLANALETIEA